MKLEHCPLPCMKINSRKLTLLMEDLKNLKEICEKVRKTFQGIGTGKDFLKRTLIIQETMLKTDKWDLIKLKKNLHSKGSSALSANMAYRVVRKYS